MVKLMEDAGFLVEVVWADRWENRPIRRNQLSAEFAHVPDGDLQVKGFDALLRPV